MDGYDVTRPDLMMILADLDALHIRASPEVDLSMIYLKDVIMTSTDYNLPPGSGDVILGVEECVCPEGICLIFDINVEFKFAVRGVSYCIL